MEEKIFMILQELQSKLDFMENETKYIKSQLQTHGNILKELEHEAVASSTKQDAMEHDIAHIRSEIEDLKDCLSTQKHASAKEWNDAIQLKAIK